MSTETRDGAKKLPKKRYEWAEVLQLQRKPWSLQREVLEVDPETHQRKKKIPDHPYKEPVEEGRNWIPTSTTLRVKTSRLFPRKLIASGAPEKDATTKEDLEGGIY